MGERETEKEEKERDLVATNQKKNTELEADKNPPTISFECAFCHVHPNKSMTVKFRPLCIPL